MQFLNMKSLSDYNSLALSGFVELVTQDIENGVKTCIDDVTANDFENEIDLIDVYLYRLYVFYHDKLLNDNSIEINTDILSMRKNINSPFYNGQLGMSFGDFMLYSVDSGKSLKCINETLTTSSDSKYHPLTVLLKKGSFQQALRVSDVCNNVPETKALQKALTIGLYYLAQQDATIRKPEDKACAEFIKKIEMPIDFKFKGKRLHMIASDLKIDATSAYINSSLLKEKANKILSKQENDSSLDLPSFNRSI
jgi:hypothetical protein